MKLYSTKDQPNVEPYPLRGLFPKLDFANLNIFKAEITSKEIKYVFFSMGALKSPRLDDFHAMFFQSQWDIIGEYVFRFIYNYF